MFGVPGFCLTKYLQYERRVVIYLEHANYSTQYSGRIIAFGIKAPLRSISL
jgi:hypothetical protein